MASTAITEPRIRPKIGSRWQRDLIHSRVRLGFCLLLLGYVALAGRLIYLQIFRHSYYVKQANELRRHTFTLPALRGSIFDRNGDPLAINVQVGDIYVNPAASDNPASTATHLASLVPNQDAAALETAIITDQGKRNQKGNRISNALLVSSTSLDIVNKVQAEVTAEIKNHQLRHPKPGPTDLMGISITTRPVRSYPNGDLAAQVIGFVNQGGPRSPGIIGKYGIEKSMNSNLAGQNGTHTAEWDAQGRMIEGTETNRIEPVNGQNLTLTIDSTIQRIAQEELEKSWTAHHAVSGTCVVIDPNNGDILALANLPTYDPNKLGKTDNAEWHNAAVTDLYEPGSTMKTLTLSACLDSEGLSHQEDKIDCQGTFKVGKYIIHCAKDPPKMGIHGVEDMRDVLKNSCNIGAAQYALRLGDEKLFRYEKAYGILERPNTGLPGEQYCHLVSPDVKRWSMIELANIAFGQGISMTPLQLASIYATLANNGVRVHPHILMDNGYTGPPQQAVKPEVASTMLSMLQTVVEDGTGKPAQIAGFNIGGKTGSAQVAEHGHYGDQYVGSFCGVVPLTHPRLVILCAINKPVGVHWGAVVAAPVVHNIAKRALWYLRAQKDNPSLADYDDKSAKKGQKTHVATQRGPSAPITGDQKRHVAEISARNRHRAA